MAANAYLTPGTKPRQVWAHAHALMVSQVYGYALIKNGRYAKVAYPMEGYSDDVAGRSFHHGQWCAFQLMMIRDL